MNPKTIESKRLFYALWPDAAVRTALHRLQRQLQLEGRPIPAAKLHITLAFLGQQPVSVLPALQTILTRLQGPEMTLTLDRIGYFKRPRIAWVGMQQVPDALAALQQDLESLLAQQAIAYTPSTTFKPHVTLVRDAAAPDAVSCAPIAWNANEVALVESVTQQQTESAAQASLYRVLALHRLDGSF